MANAKLYLIFGVLLVFVNEVKPDNIPDYLMECYSNTSLLDRWNRLPMTIGTLVEIIRKVELGSTMDMRTLAPILLNMFRVDGIEFMPGTVPQSGVLPFGVVGQEHYKWGILRNGYITKPTVPFPNNTLTAIEKCTLHFMLSKSIDSYARGDESIVCNNLRSRRNVPDESKNDIEKSERPKQGSEEPTSVETDHSNVDVTQKTSTTETSEIKLEKLNTSSANAISETEQITSSTHSTTYSTNTEIENITSSSNSTSENNVKSPTEYKTDEKEANDSNMKTLKTAKYTDNKEKQPMGRQIAKSKQTGETSTCPIENGVIYSKYGSVNIGNVIAGIATGLNPLNAPFTGNDSFINFWAATLAGDLAEVTVHQGPKYQSLKVGAEGGWNSTVLPRHYFIKTNENLELTDAEVRGGLDGLIIAKNIMSWNDKFGKTLRLSQLLSLYYSEDGIISTDTRACERNMNFSVIVPLQETVQQTFGFSKILIEASETQEVLSNALYDYSNKAANELISFVPRMQQNPCTTSNNIRTSVNATRNVEVDLYVIIESKWEFRVIQTLLIQIADQIKLHLARKTTITIITSDGFQTIVNSTRSFNDLFQWFNASTYNARGQAMDLKSLLENDIFNYFSNQSDILKQKNEAAGISTVVLFLPQESISLDDTSLNAAQKAVSKYKSVIPDLHFIYFVRSGADRLKSLAENPSDVITYSLTNEGTFDVDKLIIALGEGKRRIYNPVCGATGKTQAYNNVKYNEYIRWKYVNYYKLNSKYLFGVTSGNIKVHENGFGRIRTCYSREVEEPIWSNSADARVTCLISSNNDSMIPLSLPCKNYEFYYQCPPLYVSIEGLETFYNCRDAGCSLQTDVLVTISHEGLTCGVGCILSSKCLLTMVIMIIIKNIV